MLVLLLALGAAPPPSMATAEAHRRILLTAAFAARSGRADEAAAAKALAAIRAEVGEWHTRHAEALSLLAIVLSHRGANLRALPLRERAALIVARTKGERTLAYAEAVGDIGSTLWRLGRLEEAEARHREALALCESVKGPQSRETGAKLNNLALVVKERGRPAEAAVMLERAQELGGGIHVTHNLALAYHDLGDYSRALQRYRQAEYIYEILLNLPDRETAPLALCLANLGSLHHEMGDLDEADRVFRRAAGYYTGPMAKHPTLGTLLNNRAMLAKSMGKPREALALLEQGLALEAPLRGEDSPDIAVKRHNIATVLMELGELDNAQKVMEQAQASRRKAGAGRHAYYGNGLVELALIAEKRGDSARALKLNEEASALYLESSGPQTYRLSASRRAEARLHFQRGDARQAERRVAQALEVARLDLERCAGALSERQQLDRTASLRRNLDLCLSLPDADAYPHVLGWKGVVSDRQARLRALAQRSRDPRVRELGQQLDATARRLALLSVVSPPPAQAEAHRKELLATLARLEEKEKQLAQAEPAFASDPLTPAQLAARLPEGTALVDILAYERQTPAKDHKWTTREELAAFVVRPGQPVRRVELGEASALEKAVVAWRASAQAGGGTGAVADALAARLLKPLRPHLKAVKTLLVSPDGPVARIPWAALPGGKPGTYLLEEMAVAVVPVPRQSLPERARSEPALLVLGDVDFDAKGGSKATETSRTALRSGGESWGALPATRAEADAVAAGFEAAFKKGDVASLRREKATEESVRRLVPGRTHVHFATHGFFAPDRKRATLPPGLLSGLVLAGANRKPDPSADDGILTAREVAELDLSRCELAVLSACETGLGPSAGGEGLLGLQRAFQVAGARSAVTSLWKVPDAATADLMERFYANLWKKKMGKAEALREAQLFVLNKGRLNPAIVRALKLGSGTTTVKLPADGRMPPLAWAAWVLSGDWR